MVECVSIPHREATNVELNCTYVLLSWEFQSLIGKLQTSLQDDDVLLVVVLFQSLIGKLQTFKEGTMRIVNKGEFQSLIGKLQTLKRVINQGFLKQYSPVKVRILEIVKQRESKVSRG